MTDLSRIRLGGQQVPMLVAALLLLLAALVVELSDTNAALFLLINHYTMMLPDALWANLTFAADTLFAVCMLLLAASYRPQLLAPSLVLLVLGTLYVHGGKALFDAARPAAVLVPDSFHIIGPTLTRHSFPSGHSFTALSCWTLIILAVSPRWLMPLLVIGLLSAVSRIAVGAHWPLDVLVGSAGGILIAWLSAWLCQRYSWLNHPGLVLFCAFLLTLAAIYTPFYEDRYPFTDPLALAIAIISLTAAVFGFWIPVFKRLKQLKNRV
ncbi:phosphatase PAP2 family protein [Oceanobacter mangrovi]|uniref:phosphatase PAP2 family protein n=1 Tax=Oceanobacter mangrovi TaxID=2862510 RepID=UPI001C8EDBF4|nr:phosphatase PAP2 family protein [Oceanobacter mangrovi]